LIDGEAVPSIGAFVRVGEPLAGEEQAGSLLAAREGAEATARAARLEEGELYRPSPAEEIERGLTRLKPVFETGPQGRPGAHARRDDPRDSDAAPEITTEDTRARRSWPTSTSASGSASAARCWACHRRNSARLWDCRSSRCRNTSVGRARSAPASSDTVGHSSISMSCGGWSQRSES
jgi:hypothetical protein